MEQSVSSGEGPAPSSPFAPTSHFKLAAGYGAAIAAGIAIFLAIRSRGSQGSFGAVDGTRFVEHANKLVTLHLMCQLLGALALVVISAQLARALCRRIGQPGVIGEIIAGILIGPLIVGAVGPLPALGTKAVAPYFNVLSQVGVMLYMFLIGVEFDLKLIRKQAHSALAISHASILLPFLLGAASALWMYPRLAGPDVPFGIFSMFVGLAMSVTAFPVLARILEDRGIQRTPLGVLALGCAAVDDVTAWCLLALLVSLARWKYELALLTAALTLGYLTIMFVAVRPLVERWLQRHETGGGTTQTPIALALIGVLLSALATEYIGIHAVFGAFVFGTLIPHDSQLASKLNRKLEDVISVLFLPIFFAQIGMRTDLSLLTHAADWLACGAIIAIACIGKIGGSALLSRYSGASWRDATRLGVLMNTRGLMELVVLSLGLELQVISPRLFTWMTVMTLFTTFATVPALRWLERDRPRLPPTNAAPARS